MVSIESAVSGLFNLLDTALRAADTPIVYSSRHIQMWPDVASANKPCMILRQLSIRADQQTFGLSRWVIKAEVYLYCEASPMLDDDKPPPIATINELVNEIISALEADQDGRQTLGIPGIINCWIDGTIHTPDAVQPTDIHTIAVIPVSILAGV